MEGPQTPTPNDSLPELLRLRTEVQRLERENRSLLAKLQHVCVSQPTAAAIPPTAPTTPWSTPQRSALYEGVDAGTLEHHLDTGTLRWSHRLNTLLGDHESEIEEGWQAFLQRLHPDDVGTTQRALSDPINATASETEFRLKDTRGGFRWFRARISTVTYDGQTPMRMVGRLLDITDQKQVQNLLRESERRFATLFDQAAVCMAILEAPTAKFCRVNDMLCKLLGFRAEELRQKTWSQILPADELQRQSHKKTAPELHGECQLTHKDGSLIWVQYTFSTLRYTDARQPCQFAIIQDITERKHAEEELRRSESIQRAVMESSLDSIMLLDLDANMIFINRTAPGLTPSGVLHCSIYSFLEESDARLARACMDRVIATGQPDGYHVTYTDTDGNVTTSDTRLAPVVSGDQVVAVTAIARDETKLKRSLEALQKNEQTFAKAQQIVGMGSWEFDITTNSAACSAEMMRILGLPPDAVPPPSDQFFAQFVHPEDRDAASAAFNAALHGEDIGATEFRIIRHDDQQIRYAHIEVEATFDDEGIPQRLTGTLQDITAAKQVEIALRESEKKFRALTERSPAIVFIAESTTPGTQKIAYCNDRLREVTGYSADELAQMDFVQIVHPNFRQLVVAHQDRLCQDAPRQRYEAKIVTKAGEDCWLDISSQRIEDEGGVPSSLAICTDVSERKQSEAKLRAMEAQLSHVSRLSTMGEMVAGITHEIQQPLSAISHFAVACQNVIEATKFAQDTSVTTWLEDIGEQAVRCGDIIRRLRSFVKRHKVDQELVDLNQVVYDSVALTRSDSRNKVAAISCDLPGSGPVVLASQIQLQQVVVNLANNALDATRELTNPSIRLSIHCNHRYAQIICEDNGPGISPSFKEKLFDAFYTTKPEGLGMGLAISRSIAEAHNGTLSLMTDSANATRFRLELPHTGTESEAQHVA